MPPVKKTSSRTKKSTLNGTPKNTQQKSAAKQKSPARRSSKNKALKTKQHNVFSAKYFTALSFTALFCAGIMLGAFLLNRAYTSHIENQELAEAEQWAAKRAQQALIHQNRLASEQLRLKLQQERAQEKVNQQKKAEARISESTKNHTTNQTINHSSGNHPTSKTESNNLNTAHFSSYVPPFNSRIMAIVIDDIGYQHQEGERTLSLPGKLTVAVLPFTPFAKTLAQQAPKLNKEVMLHAPMEPKALNYWGEGLTSVMSQAQLRHDFIAMINDIPNLMGVNNHMGSRLTENSKIMEWLMAELPKRGLYFVDSRTSAQSAAYETAQKLGIPSYKRDIFLDNSRTIKDINTQFDRLIKATLKKGMALGIGHPYPETLTVLEQRMPQLIELGIELVTVSELLNAQNHRSALAVKN